MLYADRRAAAGVLRHQTVRIARGNDPANHRDVIAADGENGSENLTGRVKRLVAGLRWNRSKILR
jgi:hypothetical protein